MSTGSDWKTCSWRWPDEPAHCLPAAVARPGRGSTDVGHAAGPGHRVGAAAVVRFREPRIFPSTGAGCRRSDVLVAAGRGTSTRLRMAGTSIADATGNG